MDVIPPTYVNKKNIKATINYQSTTELGADSEVHMKQKEEFNAQHWLVKVLMYTTKFTLRQRQLLDGEVAQRSTDIEKYWDSQRQQLHGAAAPEDISPPNDTNLKSPINTTQSPLAERLVDFLDQDRASVLLLQAPNFADLDSACRYLMHEACDRKWMPVWVDLTKLADKHKDIVEQALEAEKLDRLAVSQLRDERQKHLLVIKGFDTLRLDTNLYARDHLYRWAGKVVFACHSSYLRQYLNWEYYFMPELNQRADQNGLLQISFETQNSADLLTYLRGLFSSFLSK
jgi:hypothetical protein